MFTLIWYLSCVNPVDVHDQAMMMLCVLGFVSFDMKSFSVCGVKEFHTIQTFERFEVVHHVELGGDVLELKTMAMYCLFGLRSLCK